MSFDSDAGGSGGPSWGLVLVRITTGAILLHAGCTKLAGAAGEELVLGAHTQILEAPDFYRGFAESVVLPHPWFFAKAIVAGELLGGLALFLGALTRPAGWLTALMCAGFVFAVPPEQRAFALLLAACGAACALSRAGRKTGADVFLDERLPGWVTWTRGG